MRVGWVQGPYKLPMEFAMFIRVEMRDGNGDLCEIMEGKDGNKSYLKRMSKAVASFLNRVPTGRVDIHRTEEP